MSCDSRLQLSTESVQDWLHGWYVHAQHVAAEIATQQSNDCVAIAVKVFPVRV